MPLTQILPKVEPTYFQEAVWPDYRTWTPGDPIAGVNLTSSRKSNEGTSALNWWGTAQTAGTGTSGLQLYQERMCAFFTGNADFCRRVMMSDWRISFPMETLPVLSVLQESRVMWDTFWIAKDNAGADASNQTGLRYTLRSDATNPGWTFPGGLAANSYAIIGITGGWKWEAYDNAGVLLDTVDLTAQWPVPLTAFAKVDIVHYAASPAGVASVALLVNNVPVLTRSFADVRMPSWARGGLATACWIQREIGAGAGRTVYVANMRYRAGKYDTSGAEIQ